MSSLSSLAYSVMLDDCAVIWPGISGANRDFRSGTLTVADETEKPAIAAISPVRSIPASSSARDGAVTSPTAGSQYTCRVPGG